ncbi:MAG: hypothetical protein ACYCS9_10395 [Candidatus Dormibacteria bacterium]
MSSFRVYFHANCCEPWHFGPGRAYSGHRSYTLNGTEFRVVGGPERS